MVVCSKEHLLWLSENICLALGNINMQKNYSTNYAIRRTVQTEREINVHIPDYSTTRIDRQDRRKSCHQNLLEFRPPSIATKRTGLIGSNGKMATCKTSLRNNWAMKNQSLAKLVSTRFYSFFGGQFFRWLFCRWPELFPADTKYFSDQLFKIRYSCGHRWQDFSGHFCLL